MERDPLTVLEELGGFVNAIDGTVYVSVMVGGRYFSEDLTDCGFADLREAAARLLATVENPPPLPPPPEPVYPSSPIAYKTDEGWEIDVGYSQAGVFTMLGMTLEYRRRTDGGYTLRRLDGGPIPPALENGVKFSWLDAGDSDWPG